MYDRRQTKLVLCENLEGWIEEGGGYRMEGTNVCPMSDSY